MNIIIIIKKSSSKTLFEISNRKAVYFMLFGDY